MAKKETYHHGDLRRALLDAALELLSTKDVGSLSLRQGARQAGVSHTAPYRHFEDKAALLAAVAEEGFTEFGEYLKAATQEKRADPVASLKATGVADVRYALDHPTHFRIMFGCFPAEEPAGSNLFKVSQGTFQILVDIIKQGQTTGVVRQGDPKALALSRWSLVHGLSMLLLDGMLPAKGEAALTLADSLVTDSLTSLLAWQG